MKSTYEAEGNNEMIKYGERNDKSDTSKGERNSAGCGKRARSW